MAFQKIRNLFGHLSGKPIKPSQEDVQFFGSMLIKYPEIYTVAYEPSTFTLTMSFAVSGEITQSKLQYFANLLVESLKTHRHLEGRRDQPAMEVRAEAAKTTMVVQVDRDLRDLSVDEMDLTADLMQECFGDALRVTEDAQLTDEFINAQEDLFANLLDRAHRQPPKDRLSGYREAGRVIVYNGRVKR